MAKNTAATAPAAVVETPAAVVETPARTRKPAYSGPENPRLADKSASRAMTFVGLCAATSDGATLSLGRQGGSTALAKQLAGDSIVVHSTDVSASEREQLFAELGKRGAGTRVLLSGKTPSLKAGDVFGVNCGDFVLVLVATGTPPSKTSSLTTLPLDGGSATMPVVFGASGSAGGVSGPIGKLRGPGAAERAAKLRDAYAKQVGNYVDLGLDDAVVAQLSEAALISLAHLYNLTLDGARAIVDAEDATAAVTADAEESDESDADDTDVEEDEDEDDDNN